MPTCRGRMLAAAWALGLLAAAGSLADTRPGTASAAPDRVWDPALDSRLAQAAPFLAANLANKLKNGTFTAHWLPSGDRFWYERQTATGSDLLMVEAATGKQRPCNIQAGECRPTTTGSSPDDAVASPSGDSAVFRRGHDLWLRMSRTGDERRLTQDGVENFAYGDVDGYVDSGKVFRRRAGRAAPLYGVVWSPSGRYVLALRQDLRSVPERLMVTEYLPPDGEYTVQHLRRTAIARDPQRPDSALTIIEPGTGQSRPIKMDPQSLNDWALPYFLTGILWWTHDESSVFLVGANRGGSRYQLLQVDLASGRTRIVLTETARFNVRLNPYDYARPDVYVTSSGREAIWYSERDGWGHLYLYDVGRGVVKRQLTRGDWVVADLLRVDERRRLVYFSAVAREHGRNPYYRHLYRVSLDGGTTELLTPEDADHDFNTGFAFEPGYGAVPGSSFAPSGRYFVDSFSNLQQPLQAVLRTSAGKPIATVVTGDDSQLRALHWRPPEYVVVKAADGRTDLHGVLYKPTSFDPAKRYPVIEETYPGPQGRTVPNTIARCVAQSTAPDSFDVIEPEAFAELGFIVVVIDGRGTAYRSREFRDAYLGTEDVFGAADHVAAIRNMASTRPYMDLERVGITGRSYGGYGSLRAMLLYPDVYKVAVSSVGPGAWLDFQQEVSTERFFGVPADSVAARAYYDLISNTRLVDRLRGRLLLIYGGIDEDVPLKMGLELVQALIDADRPFDSLLVPQAPHHVGSEPYALKRTMMYFMEHLGAPR